MGNLRPIFSLSTPPIYIHRAEAPRPTVLERWEQSVGSCSAAAAAQIYSLCVFAAYQEGSVGLLGRQSASFRPPLFYVAHKTLHQCWGKMLKIHIAIILADIAIVIWVTTIIVRKVIL